MRMQADIEAELGFFQQMLNEIPTKLANFSMKFAIALLIFLLGGKFISLIRKVVKKSLTKMNAELGVIQFLDSLLRIGLYVVLVIWIASYFGLETTSLIAVLGSAGVTLALALQGSLSNFTGGVLILLLKPFRVGDYIIEDNKGNEGTVVEIQLFYTKLRTTDDKIVILPNGTLANTSLTNASESKYRKLIALVGISYDADLKKAKQLLNDLIKDQERICHNMDYCVYVEALDSSQVTLGIRCYVKNEDYFSVKWDLMEKIKETFDENKIAIPYPQLDVHLDS